MLKNNQKFWAFARDSAGKASLTLYGELSDTTWWGDEVTPAAFAADLQAIGEDTPLTVYINSPGGDVFAGITLYNLLKRHKGSVTTHIDGLAASAASIVAMAGDKIVMPEAALMMIHRAWTVEAGNAAALRAMAEELERVDGQLAGIYGARTGKPAEEALALMEAETWMTGQEALEAGFCDELEPNKQLAALCGGEILARYQRAPAALFKQPIDGGESQPVEDTLPQAGDKLAAQKRRFSLRKKIMEENGHDHL